MKTIKGNQRGKGGARPGAGRKPGSANRKTREIADRAAAEGVTPLEYMLRLMRRPYPKDSDARIRVECDSLRFEAAKAAAPYLHPRLANRDTPIGIGPLDGGLPDQGRQVLGALSDGRLTPGEATTVMQALAAQAKVVETHELEKRLAALEEKFNAKATGREHGGPGGGL